MRTTVECMACGNQCRAHETEAGHCPDCGGETASLAEIYAEHERASAEPGELVVPISLHIDDALLRRKTATVRIDIPTPDTPTAEVQT